MEKSSPDVCAILSELRFEFVVVDTECSLSVLCVKSGNHKQHQKTTSDLTACHNSVDS